MSMYQYQSTRKMRFHLTSWESDRYMPHILEDTLSHKTYITRRENLYPFLRLLRMFLSLFFSRLLPSAFPTFCFAFFVPGHADRSRTYTERNTCTQRQEDVGDTT